MSINRLRPADCRQNPYTRHNGYQEAGIGINSGCSIIDNTLDLKLNLYGINEYALKPAGKFETDDSRTRALINRLSLVYSASDSVQFEAGKFAAPSGMFFCVRLLICKRIITPDSSRRVCTIPK